MNEEVKEIFMKSVTQHTFRKVKGVFKRHKLVHDETFFDYELLQYALLRNDCQIVSFLLDYCRVRNPNNVNLEKTVLYLAMKNLTEPNKHKLKCDILRKILKNENVIFDKNQDGETALYVAFKKGHVIAVDIVLTLISTNSYMKGLNPKDPDDNRHFYVACATLHYNAMKLYLSHGFDVNSLNPSTFPGFTALHLATERNKKEIVKLLLDYGADCNKIDTEGNAPLHIAFYNMPAINDVKQKLGACGEEVQSIIDMLIPKIPRGVDCINKKGLSYFHIVCSRNDVAMFNDFLQSGVSIDSYVVSGMCSGFTALHFAVFYNQKAIVEKLLKENFQVNCKTIKYQLTPLHLACSFGYHKIRYFDGYDINSTSDCLDFTLNRNSQLDIIKLLIQFGADIEAKDSSGKTPLLHTGLVASTINHNYFTPAIQKEINEGNKDIVNLLLLNKANINARTNCQGTILHISSKTYFLNVLPTFRNILNNDQESVLEIDTLEHLINQGANVNAVDEGGFTPLHIAVQLAKKDLVCLFLKHGADVNAKNNDSLIPLHFALNNYYKYRTFGAAIVKDILCALLEKGSNVNLLNENNEPPLNEALMKCNNFVTEKLLFYGADINMTDSRGRDGVYSLFNVIKQHEIESVNRLHLFQLVFAHVQKLLALGSYVNAKELICHNTLLICYLGKGHRRLVLKYNCNSIFDSCVEELNVMKLIKITNCTSLYDILQKSEHDVAKHVRNSTLVKILENQNIEFHYPFYSSFLKIKYQKSLKRSDLLSLAKLALSRAIRFNLPDLCSDSVFQYLAMEDLTNLIAAASSSMETVQSNNATNSNKQNVCQ